MAPPTFLEWSKALPAATAATLIILWIIHVVRLLTGWIAAGDYSLAPTISIPSEAYRLVTGAVLHGDGLHITLNSLALARTGSKVENAFGTSLYAWLQFFCIVSAGCLYVFIMNLGGATSGESASWTHQATVGFSGCLFALFVIEVETAPEDGDSLSLFGRIKIPPRLVPWAFILIVQLMIPNVSFVGHVSGALVGLFLSRGLGLYVLPPRSLVVQMDAKMGSWSAYRSVFYRGNINPFEISSQKPFTCDFNLPSASSLLPMSQPSQQPSVAQAPPSSTGDAQPRFPTTGGRRLGSS